MNNPGFASFFCRLSLGVFVGMIGVQKVFVMGASVHAQNFFVTGFKDHWIPDWLLLGLWDFNFCRPVGQIQYHHHWILITYCCLRAHVTRRFL